MKFGKLNKKEGSLEAILAVFLLDASAMLMLGSCTGSTGYSLIRDVPYADMYQKHDDFRDETLIRQGYFLTASRPPVQAIIDVDHYGKSLILVCSRPGVWEYDHSIILTNGNADSVSWRSDAFEGGSLRDFAGIRQVVVASVSNSQLDRLYRVVHDSDTVTAILGGEKYTLSNHARGALLETIAYYKSLK